MRSLDGAHVPQSSSNFTKLVREMKKKNPPPTLAQYFPSTAPKSVVVSVKIRETIAFYNIHPQVQGKMRRLPKKNDYIWVLQASYFR